VKGVWTSNPPEVLAGNTEVTNAHLDVANLPAGETIFYWTLSDDTYTPEKCDAKPTHINVVNKQYNGTPLEDQYLCENYYTMTASTLPTTAEGEWSLVKTSDANANISSADNTNNFMHVENLGKNENTFKWTVKNYFTEADKAAHNNNYCESEQEVSLFNMSFEADANANTDSKEINICGTDGQLNGKTYTADYDISWEADNATIATGEETLSNPHFTLIGASSKFTMTVTRKLPGGKTCPKTDYVTVYNRKPDEVAIDSKNSCDGKFELNGSVGDDVNEFGYWTKESAMGTFKSTDPAASITNTHAYANSVTLEGLA
jgi:hypothetical protein